MNAAIETQAKVVGSLLESGQLRQSELPVRQVESEITGRPLVEVLVQHDHLSDETLAQVYADYYGLRYLDLRRRKPVPGWALSLPENVARLKKCIIFGEVGGNLVVAVADPGDASVTAAVEARFDRAVQYVVSPEHQITEAQDELYGEARRRGARATEVVPAASAAATVSASGLNMSEQLDSLIDEAVDRRASDIHIEPEKDRLRVRYRIDGRLIEARAYPMEVAPALISRIKVLSNLDITERRRPLDGRFAHQSFAQNIDVRVAVIPASNGERATLRLLALDRATLSLESLGMSLEIRQAFERLIHRPHGIILITGPTGSGKSTTMYAALSLINHVDRHIITIEDPVEYNIPGVNQVQVDAEFGVGFATALRSILRHDPDIIMVGEIRDQETAHLALEASLTGHLVFATLHTNSAVGSLTRLLDMGCEPYLISSAIIGAMAQRLVRKICVNCRKAFAANPTERRLMRVPEERTEVQVYRGTGCARCGRTGYYDRLGIFEYVPFDTGLAELVMNKASTENMYNYATEHGAVMLRDDAIIKVRQGLTTLEEAMRVTVAEIY